MTNACGKCRAFFAFSPPKSLEKGKTLKEENEKERKKHNGRTHFTSHI